MTRENGEMARDDADPGAHAGPSATVRCPSCGTRGDAVPLRPGRLPVCGACGATLPLDRPVRLSAEDFPASAVEAEVPVLVAFSAEWCGPCGWLKPYLKEVAASEAGRLLVFDVDVDEATAIARTHRIGSVPTVLLLHGGKEEDRSVGVEPHRIREMAVRFRGSDEPSEPG